MLIEKEIREIVEKWIDNNSSGDPSGRLIFFLTIVIQFNIISPRSDL